jgi:hypothetical protein
MTGIVNQLDIASLVKSVTAVKSSALTAAGSGDATTVTGITIDRLSFSGSDVPLTAQFIAAFDATLASGSSLSVGITVQDSADSASWSAYATLASAIIATGPSGGGEVYGQATLGVSLRSARQYVRMLFTPDLSRAGTDTAVGMGVAVLSGFDEVPAPT